MSYYYCETCHVAIESGLTMSSIACEFCHPDPKTGRPHRMTHCDLHLLKLKMAKNLTPKTYYCYCYECELLCYPRELPHIENPVCPKANFNKPGHKACPIDVATLTAYLESCTHPDTKKDVRNQLYILAKSEQPELSTYYIIEPNLDGSNESQQTKMVKDDSIVYSTFMSPSGDQHIQVIK